MEKQFLDSRVIFVTGKGGVGKSALTWAMALKCQKLNRKVMVVHWNELKMSEDLFGVETYCLEPLDCFKEYALKRLRFEKFYDVAFGNKIFKSFLRVAPGLSDTVIAGKILDLYSTHEDALVLVDLPGTGHALSFLKSPYGIEKIFGMGFIREDVREIIGMFEDERTKIYVVSVLEELPTFETIEFCKNIKPSSLNLGCLILNQVTPSFDLPQRNEILADYHECFDRYRKGQSLQVEQRAELLKLGLPMVEIPYFPESEFKNIVGQIEESLFK